VIPLRDVIPSRRRPVITTAFTTACIAVFAIELLVSSAGGDPAVERFFEAFGVIPAALTGNTPATGPIPPLLTLVTYQFLHAGWLHLAGNLLFLWIFGNNVEDRFGRPAYLLFYLGGGVVAALVQVGIDPTSSAPLVGASGSIAAVLGAYLALFPRARVVSLVFLGFFFQLMEVRAVILLGLWFVLQLLDGVASLGSTGGSGVATFAHIAGFLAGLAVGLLLRWGRPGWIRMA
jgi:membrane associated rhomboid family serine protease